MTQSLSTQATTGPDLAAADVAEPVLAKALAYWKGLIPPGAELPPSATFEVAEVPPDVLRMMVVCSGFLPGGRLKASFAGTVAAMFGGRDVSGRYLDEAYPPALYPGVEQMFRMVEELQRPVLVRQRYASDGLLVLELQRLALPFADVNGWINPIPVVMAYRPEPGFRREVHGLLKPGLEMTSALYHPVIHEPVDCPGH